MIELEPYVFEALYLMKEMYDHGKGDEMLNACGHLDADGEAIWEVTWTAIESVFDSTRQYYDGNDENEILSIRDPAFSRFFILCEQYEEKRGIAREDNPYWKQLSRAINYSFSFDSWDFDVEVVPGRGGRKSGIILKMGCEFCSHVDVPMALMEIKVALIDANNRLHVELFGKAKVVMLPEVQQIEDKEAA